MLPARGVLDLNDGGEFSLTKIFRTGAQPQRREERRERKAGYRFSTLFASLRFARSCLVAAVLRRAFALSFRVTSSQTTPAKRYSRAESSSRRSDRFRRCKRSRPGPAGRGAPEPSARRDR